MRLDSGLEQQLYWRCRRGMLELDIMLQGFFQKDYNRLDETGKKAFIRLLDLPDAVLLELLFCRTVSSDQEIDRVIKQIRAVTTH